MIVLDTNVISELGKERPNAGVAAWFLRQPAGELSTTTISFAEVHYGLELLPHGRRRRRLTDLSQTIFETALRIRRLPFDDAVAYRYAALRASRRGEGRPISAFDAQIAAIALAAGASLATRNVADFEGCGVKLIDPWNATD